MTDAARAAIAALWLRHRARMFARLDVVDAAVQAAAAGTLDDAMREEARREAHRLAGSLGTFGLDEGTAPARLLEDALGDAAPSDTAVLRTAAAELRTILEAAPAA